MGVKRDLTAEQDETFSLILSNPVGATIGRAGATGTILNDDAPATPTITSTNPVSPSTSTSHAVIGTSGAGTTVDLFFDESCSGAPEASGSAASFASPGITPAVHADATTTIHARESLGAVSSPCSTGIDYVHSSPPPPPTASGTLWGWGDNDFGQVGDGKGENRFSPTQVGTDTDCATISTGVSHTCATSTDATLWCWGSNSAGQVGDGTTDLVRSSPVQVGTGSEWATVSAGGGHNLGIRSP